MILAEVLGPGLFIVLVAAICGLVVPVWAIADAASHSPAAFYGAGSNKTAWIVVLVVSLIFGLGFFLGGFYLISTRRKLRDQEQIR